MKTRCARHTWPCALLTVAGCISCVYAAPALAESTTEDLTSLSLEELSTLKVTSVSKRAESVADAAASIFVITNESIRRAGAASLPEALRLAPNLQVAQADARNFAVTARGFNSAFENKLLVLIDGRSVYTPLFSGVFWDAQDVVLEDVERIEVISGPGATLWGANAVNGVINIITKTASATQGALASAGGDRDQRSAEVRFGGELGNGGHYRVYAKTSQRDDLETERGAINFTGMRRAQVGFRADWGRAADSSTFQGDAYSGALHQLGTAEIEIGGANLLYRKSIKLENGDELSAQFYIDHTERSQPNAFIEHLTTIDGQLQSAAVLGSHRLVYGAGYRNGNDHLENDVAFGFLPAALGLHWGNVFVQDEVDLSPNLRLIAGAKFEHNNYTGLEFLPTIRLAYKASATDLLWAAASRTVRAPSRIDRDFYSPTTPVVVGGAPQFAIGGGPDFQAEVARVAELGYRAQPLASFSYSATAFFGDYDRLRTLEPNPRGPGAVFSNLASGRVRGIESWCTWQASPHWRLAAGFVAQHVGTTLAPVSKDASGTSGLATSDPSNYWSLRSSWDFSERHSLDLRVRQNGKLDRPAVPAYTSVGVNYVWRPAPSVELSIQGENLTDQSHAEFGSAPGRAVYERKLGARLTWRL